ncbi:MAG: ferredoxin:glutaredoxin reductase [Thermoplasmata archaeon]|nr:MAG: ferredoxin:glutaredoxin reductase [Thermoplasmata archaeon]
MADKEEILKRMRNNAEENGDFICPDAELLSDLVDGLATNEDRYGYGSCPCRVSSGIKLYDADIICPCEYRDADVNEFGMCYCGLFVSKELNDDPSKMGSIPERRPVVTQEAAVEAKEMAGRGEKVGPPMDEGSHEHVKVGTDKNGLPVWRCIVCGYLCARELPPSICPICKAKADKFERFEFGK